MRRSLYLELPRSPFPVDWRWPIRLGFLADPRSRALRERFERELASHSALAPFVLIAGADQASSFDFLVVPAPLAGARELLLAAPAAVRANALLVLDPGFDRAAVDADAARGEVAALLELTQARGVALAPVREGEEAEWLRAVLYRLADRSPLDAAIEPPGPFAEGRQALLFAEPALLSAVQVREVSRRAPERAIREEPEVPVKGPRFEGFSLGSAESEDDVTRSPGHPPVKPGRFLQATVTEEGRQTPAIAAWAGRRYDVAVKIGPPEAGALVAARRFPDEELPESAAGHLLAVVFSEPRLLAKPQLKTIVLPRDGASSSCSFALTLPADVQAVEARITVLYENRVLQTARLSGRMGEPWTFELEMIVRPGMKNLSRQERFDGALILDPAGDGGARVTVAGGYRPATFSVVGLEEAIALMEARINATPWDDPAFASLDAPGSVELLIVLASHGERLFRELLRYAPGHPFLTGDGPVQLISTENGAPLPLELLYSRQAPNDDAVLCPQWRQALETGACDCPDDGSVVCPLGFWCFRRVIERHRFDPAQRVETEGRAYALKDVPPGGDAAVLQPLSGIALGASQRVSGAVAGALESLVEALGHHLGRPIEPAHDWEDWARRIQATSPSLLMLLPHTEKNARQIPTLEISGATLASNRVRREHVLGPAGHPHPVVLLLGCNTDGSDIPFESFVPSFADQQAAVIVTSLSKILGRHAAPLAQTFVDQLAQFPNDGSHRFGEVMRQVRRQAALTGPPLALVLKAYGDADWRI